MLIMMMLLWLSGGFTSSSTDSLPPYKPKATWLWNTSLIGTSAGRTDILQFAKNQQIGCIFLQVNPEVAQSTYRSFIKAAADYDIQVHALDGAPKWALPENRQKITDLVNWVKSYNASVLDNERFGGIQVDIEPYLLPEWTADQNKVAVDWQQSLSYFHELVKKDSTLTTAAAVPFWLDNIQLPDGSGSLSEAIMAKLDETALMSYRDQALDVVTLAASEIATGNRLGKKVWISVETKSAPDTPYITFYGKGKTEMESQLALIDGVLKAQPSFTGIAVHDYTSWRALGN
ncbi:hypothetical protein SAMN04487897_11547 [Paenibacillus sp. yr247]|uniref:hypothetical protein n=1 Tax=Paenibacillus sp. yr247 TaxID=1761880 RepID=UPI000880BEF0|nr:hypothetical protein [Paenibacillus sp. yr247]SDO48861.1 hypothetical protein SAMN04487897_11547 [Paenibacillus sp. yr247]